MDQERREEQIHNQYRIGILSFLMGLVGMGINNMVGPEYFTLYEWVSELLVIGGVSVLITNLIQNYRYRNKE